MSGLYKFTLEGVSHDGSRVSQELGNVQVWFKDGSPQTVDDGVLPEFKLKEEIIA